MNAKDFWIKWLKPIVTGLICAYLIHTFVFFIAMVSSNSMLPNIQVGDRVLVARVHSFTDLKRGDVLLFEFGGEEGIPKMILVKRLIGLPGDTVEIKNGKVYVNGELIREDYETVADPASYFSGSIKVPANQYLFLGDNRPNSFDSRFWEKPFIPREKIIGKAVLVVCPLNRMKRL